MLSNMSQLLEFKMYNPSLCIKHSKISYGDGANPWALPAFVGYRIRDNNNKQPLEAHKCIF